MPSAYRSSRQARCRTGVYSALRCPAQCRCCGGSGIPTRGVLPRIRGSSGAAVGSLRYKTRPWAPFNTSLPSWRSFRKVTTGRTATPRARRVSEIPRLVGTTAQRSRSFGGAAATATRPGRTTREHLRRRIRPHHESSGAADLAQVACQHSAGAGSSTGQRRLSADCIVAASSDAATFSLETGWLMGAQRDVTPRPAATILREARISASATCASPRAHRVFAASSHARGAPNSSPIRARYPGARIENRSVSAAVRRIRGDRSAPPRPVPAFGSSTKQRARRDLRDRRGAGAGPAGARQPRRGRRAVWAALDRPWIRRRNSSPFLARHAQRGLLARLDDNAAFRGGGDSKAAASRAVSIGSSAAVREYRDERARRDLLRDIRRPTTCTRVSSLRYPVSRLSLQLAHGVHPTHLLQLQASRPQRRPPSSYGGSTPPGRQSSSLFPTVHEYDQSPTQAPPAASTTAWRGSARLHTTQTSFRPGARLRLRASMAPRLCPSCPRVDRDSQDGPGI